MFADAAPIAFFLRLLSRVEHCDRTAPCPMAVGSGPLFCRGVAHPPASDHPDRDAVLFTKADTGRGCRSKPAEDDDVHAPYDGLFLLLRIRGTCTILVDQQSSGNRSAAYHQQVHAASCSGSASAE